MTLSKFCLIFGIGTTYFKKYVAKPCTLYNFTWVTRTRKSWIILVPFGWWSIMLSRKEMEKVFHVEMGLLNMQIKRALCQSRSGISFREAKVGSLISIRNCDMKISGNVTEIRSRMEFTRRCSFYNRLVAFTSTKNHSFSVCLNFPKLRNELIHWIYYYLFYFYSRSFPC